MEICKYVAPRWAAIPLFGAGTFNPVTTAILWAPGWIPCVAGCPAAHEVPAYRGRFRGQALPNNNGRRHMTRAKTFAKQLGEVRRHRTSAGRRA